ncbi:hypothetical protein [Arthrobacter sunyaminii]|uniref:Sensor domain-containing protein n=1 Tax=Arthrobacter sunyaminii TaxID=2816859 RepID=A0A975S7N1_9MICC|nr:hypothetical protein [Arthrobacter sunyaminii]MBO0908313.1 hypothetical protein [Arthrobacter sunyaminii]QWQ37300.1 hypothetical protein KG104_06005 [Arthrobacter sunyaminii]
MNKSMKAGALLVAGVFALSGCGSSDEGSEAASESSPSATPTPTPTLAVGQEQYTPAELETALAAILADRGMAGEIITQQDLAPMLEGAPDQLAGVVITPEQCDVLASADIAATLDSANMAMIMLSETDTLTIASHPSASIMDKQVQDNTRLLEDCAQFQMEAGGQVISAAVDSLDASTDGQTTQAFRTTITAAEQVTDTVQVSAVSGTTNVQVSMTGNLTTAAESEEAIAQAETIINEVLAELEK